MTPIELLTELGLGSLAHSSTDLLKARTVREAEAVLLAKSATPAQARLLAALVLTHSGQGRIQF